MNQAQRILGVDDNLDNLDILEELLAEEFQFKAVADGEEALRVAPEFVPDIVLLDQFMPALDGYETCRRMTALPELRDTKIIMLSAGPEVADRLRAYEAGVVDYITKPFNHQEVLAKVPTWMKMAQRRGVNQIWCDMEKIRDGIGRTLTSLVELRDTETGEHLFRMRWYSQMLAEQLTVSGPYRTLIDESFLERLYRASPLHDIGKIGIDDAILRKPGWLSPLEFETIKSHTVIGAEILEQTARNMPYADYLNMAIKIARHHHERFDGTGYPDGISGDDIPLSARIVAVADVFDAVTSDRVNRKALSMEQSVQIIEGGAGTLFDGAIVDAFRERLDDFKQGQARFRLLEKSPAGSAELLGDSLHAKDTRQVDHREHDPIGA